MQAQIINSIFSLFSPKEDGGEAKSCSSGLFFLLTSPHPKAIQEPTKSCFIRKDSYQEIPRDLGALSETGVNDQRQKMLGTNIFNSQGNYKGFRSCSQEPETKTKICISYNVTSTHIPFNILESSYGHHYTTNALFNILQNDNY